MPYYKMDAKGVNITDSSEVNTNIDVKGIEYDVPQNVD